MRSTEANLATTIAPPTVTSQSALLPLLLIAAGTMLAHWIGGHNYGFHRDELATLDDARHLAWGFVAYPPVTPFFGRLSLMIFGESLAGFRFFASFAEAVAVVLTGLIARELGAGRRAQILAATAAVPFCIVGGALMQYVSFDYLFWVLTAYFAVRLLQSEDPRWWVAIGTSVGLGLMTKYTMLLFATSVLAGFALTRARRFLASRWLLVGVAVLLIIVTPNLIWQARHGFITAEFLSHIHARDVRIGRTKNFLPDQLKLTLFGFPIAVAGLAYLFSSAGRRFRPIAWMYLLPLVLFILMKGRGYYLAAAYPMLFAAGAIALERRVANLARPVSIAMQALVWILLVADVALVAFIALPLGPPDSKWAKASMKQNGDLREEIGWPELVQTVAQIRDKLPADDRAHLGVLAGNYGEAGAVSLYGPRYNLPTPISGINSFWERGYGNPPPQTLIVVGLSTQYLDEIFASCQLAGHTGNPYGIRNEETEDHPDIFVCRGLRQPWPAFWAKFRYFG